MIVTILLVKTSRINDLEGGARPFLCNFVLLILFSERSRPARLLVLDVFWWRSIWMSATSNSFTCGVRDAHICIRIFDMSDQCLIIFLSNINICFIRRHNSWQLQIIGYWWVCVAMHHIISNTRNSAPTLFSLSYFIFKMLSWKMSRLFTIHRFWNRHPGFYREDRFETMYFILIHLKHF